MKEAGTDTGLELHKLRDQVDECARTLRWLWTMNLAAAVVAIAVQRYELAAVAGATALVALFGAGVARGAQGTLAKTTSKRRQDQEQC
jgi:hypothetical protein